MSAEHLLFEQSPMPVSALATSYPHGHIIAPHTHECAQLLYAIQGVMIIEAHNGRWVVPPSHGIWLVPGAEHSVRMSGDVLMRTVFVKSQSLNEKINSDILAAFPAINHLPGKNCVVAIKPLLKELILAATELPLSYNWNSRDGRLVSLLLDELNILPILPMYLAWPEDERIRRVCDQLSRSPADETTIAQWAQRLHMSEKTFHRLFKQTTGVTFGRWRQQIRLLLALEKIAHGEKIITVALAHGYESQSAFTAMFKKFFGVSPSAFYE